VFDFVNFDLIKEKYLENPVVPGKSFLRFLFGSGCLWPSGISSSIAYNWSWLNMKTGVKIIHARFVSYNFLSFPILFFLPNLIIWICMQALHLIHGCLILLILIFLRFLRFLFGSGCLWLSGILGSIAYNWGYILIQGMNTSTLSFDHEHADVHLFKPF